MSNMINFLFNNGDKVKTKVAGFKGIIDARAQHINGCNRYSVQPPVAKDGSMADGYWFDEPDILLIEAKKVETRPNDRGGFHSRHK